MTDDIDLDERNPVEHLGEEFLERRRRGESVSVDDYVLAHPDCADQIQRLFPAMLALERFKSSALSSHSGGVAEFEEPPEQLGDFRILHEIGRGGMGVIYEAEQQSLRRRVALKVFPRKTLQDSKRLDRFHAEARTAARLHHTNIVPVFGVGEQDGLHYFVMQRIDGESLDQIVEHDTRMTRFIRGDDDTERKPSGSTGTDFPIRASDSRLRPHRNRSSSNDLNSIASAKPIPSASTPTTVAPHPFPDGSRREWNWIADVGIQVCQALQYAHSQGVLHRDIKPSNLMLDPDGTVWVTDFGLATVVAADDLEAPKEVAGTLRFMAPEHIGGKQDARSDQYSLGLTLYELMTRQPGFEAASRAKLISDILAGNLKPPREIRPEIPRDLEAIVGKATRRDPELRYANVTELMIDLNRFRQGRPVSARRVGPVNRLSRWGKRNPMVASLSAALLLLTVGSFVVVSAKWRDTVVANERAEANLSLALESLDQILARFGSSWMAHPMTPAEDSTGVVEFQMAVSDHSASVLQDALKFYDQFAKQNPTNPQLNRDTAKVHLRVADIYHRLGQIGKAEQAYERSLAFLDSVVGTNDPDLILEKASTRNQLGLALYSASRFGDAVKEFGKALKLLSGPAVTLPELQAERARILTNLAQTQSLMFRREQALLTQRQAVALLEDLVKQHPTDNSYRLALAQAYRSNYRLLPHSRHHDAKTSRHHDQIRIAGVQILEDLVTEYPAVPDFRYELSDMLATNAYWSGSDQNQERRNADLNRSIDLARELAASHPSIPRYRSLLGRALSALAQVRRADDPLAAEELFEESIVYCRLLTLEFETIPAYRVFLVKALDDYSKNLSDMGRLPEARAVLEEAIENQRVYVRLRPENRFGRSMLGRLYSHLAETLENLDEPEAAQQADLEASRLHTRSRTRSRNSSSQTADSD